MRYSVVPVHSTLAEVNIIPLADVLLVLLVVFMVASPVLSQRIGLDLPGPGQVDAEPPPPLDLRIDAVGQLSWNGSATSLQALPALMREAATAGDGPPLLSVDADPDSDYQTLARVLAAARNSGLHRVGFVQRP